RHRVQCGTPNGGSYGYPVSIAQARRTRSKRFANPSAPLFISVATLRLPDHFRDGFAGGDEGEDVLGVRNNDVEDVRFFGVEHALEGGSKIFLIHDAFGGYVEALRDLHEVRIDRLHVLGVAEVGMAAVALIKLVFP